MKALILAGGFGTVLSEQTDIRPKPMVKISSKPILWHIMKTYPIMVFNVFSHLKTGYPCFVSHYKHWKIVLNLVISVRGAMALDSILDLEKQFFGFWYQT